MGVKRFAIFVLCAFFVISSSSSFATSTLQSSDFWLEDVQFSNYKKTGSVKLLAKFVNGSSTHIQLAKFSITVYDSDDNILDVFYFTVSNIAPYERRPVKIILECPSEEAIDKYELKYISTLQ